MRTFWNNLRENMEKQEAANRRKLKHNTRGNFALTQRVSPSNERRAARAASIVAAAENAEENLGNLNDPNNVSTSMENNLLRKMNERKAARAVHGGKTRRRKAKRSHTKRR